MASTGEVWKLGHRPALDGVRGIAVLMVLTTHLRIPGFALAPAVGVVVFFALSGFLITTLLLERDESLRRFYLRRAARLVPALVACVALYISLQLAFTGRVNDWARSADASECTAQRLAEVLERLGWGTPRHPDYRANGAIITSSRTFSSSAASYSPASTRVPGTHLLRSLGATE